MLTLAKIAKETGVCKSTVSFVLNGKAKQNHISDATVKKIQDYCRRVNYLPNIHAVRMNREIVGNIMVLLNTQDAVSGKRTLVVRFGARAGLILYFLLGLLACWCCFYFILLGKLFAVVLPQIYLLLHILTTVKMAKINHGKELNRILGETSRNMFIFGLLLALGLIL